jgi:hypothetical protein
VLLGQALETPDLAQRIRNLERVAGVFGAFPPFWWKLGEAALVAERLDLARDALRRQVDLACPLLQATPEVLDACKFLFLLETDRTARLAMLDRILHHLDPYDWASRLFVGKEFASLGETDRGTYLLEALLDDPTVPREMKGAAGVLLANVYGTAKNTEMVEKTIQRLGATLDPLLPLYELGKKVDCDGLPRLIRRRLGKIACTLADNGDFQVRVPENLLGSGIQGDLRVLNRAYPLAFAPGENADLIATVPDLRERFFSESAKSPRTIRICLKKPVPIDISFRVTSETQAGGFLSLSTETTHHFRAFDYEIAKE